MDLTKLIFTTTTVNGISEVTTKLKLQEQAILSDVKALQIFERGFTSAEDKAQFFAETMGEASQKAQDYARKIEEGTGNAAKYADSQSLGASATEKLGKSFDVAAIKAKALNLAMNVGVMLAVTAAIQGLIWVYENVIKAQQKAVETARQLAEEYKSLKSEAETIANELKTIGERINELNSKPNLTFAEQSELDKLKESNEELQRQLDIKQKLADLKGVEAQDAAIKVLNQKSERSVEQYTSSGTYNGHEAKNYQAVDRFEAIREQMRLLENLRVEQVELEDKIRAMSSDDIGSRDWYKYTNLLKINTDAQQKADLYIQQTTDSIIEQGKSLLDSTPEGKAYKQMISDLTKEVDLFNKTDIKTADFDKVFNADEFSKAKEQIESLAKSGKLTADVLRSGFPEVSQALAKMGISAEQAAEHINASFGKVDPSPAVQSVEALSKNLETISSNASLLSDIRKEISETGGVSVDTIKRLQEANYNLNDVLYVQNGKILANTDAIRKETLEKQNSIIKTYEDAIAKDEATISTNNLRIAEEELALATLQISSASDEAITAQQNKIAVIESENVALQDNINNNKENIDIIEASAASIQGVADAYKQYTDAIDATQSALKTITSAQEEYKKHKEITIDTVQSLISLDAEYLDALVDENGQINLNSQAVANLINDKTAYLQALAAEQVATYAVTSLEKLMAEATGEAGTAAQDATGGIQAAASEMINMASTAMTAAVASDSLKAALDRLAGEKGAEGIDLEAWKDKVVDYAQDLSAVINAAGKGIGGFTGNYGGSGSSKKETDKWLEAFKAAHEELKHLQATDEVSTQEYYNRLKKLDNDYFSSKEMLAKHGDKYLSERRKNEEELYKLLQTLYSEDKAELDRQLAYKLISQADYIDKLEVLNNKYFKNNTETYKKNELEIYNLRKKFLEDYIADLEKSYKKRLEASNKRYESEIKSLKERRESQSDYYDDLISAEQEKLSLLNKQATEEDRLLKIEQARLELAKAQAQQTSLVYREGQGFVYEADFEAVSQAQQNLTDLLKDYQDYQDKLKIEEQIARYKKAKDDAISIIDESISRLEEMKTQAADNISSQMERLQELSEKWSESLDISEDSEFYKSLLDVILGDEQSSYSSRLNELKSFIDSWNKQVSKMKEPKSSGSGLTSGGLISGTTKNGGTYYLVPNDKSHGYSDGGVVSHTGGAVVHGTPNEPELMLNQKGIKNVGAALGITGSTKSVAQQLNTANSGQLDTIKLLSDFVNTSNPISALNLDFSPTATTAKINSISSQLGMRSAPNLSGYERVMNNNGLEKPVSLTIQKIEMHGVNDMDAFEKKIENTFENTMLQLKFKR